MPSENLHDGGQGRSVFQSPVRGSGWYCDGRFFATYKDAEAYKKTLDNPHYNKKIIRHSSQTTALENMTTKKPRRLRIRKKSEGVDQALIDKLVEQTLAKRTKELLKIERMSIRKKGEEEGFRKGHAAGYNEGHSKGQDEGQERATRNYQQMMATSQSLNEQLFGTNIMEEAGGSARHENLNQGWGFMTPYVMQNRCESPHEVSIFAYKPELYYEYRQDIRQRQFQLRIWKGFQDGHVDKIEVVCNFSEDTIEASGEGASVLVNFLCTICVEGAKHMDAAQLCEYMADWITSPRTRIDPDTPTIMVPKSARPQALAKFRSAVGLKDGN